MMSANQPISSFNILKSNFDRRAICQITCDACILTDTNDLNLLNPTNRPSMVQKLNDGLFNSLSTKYLSSEQAHDLLILGALAMRLGASTSAEQRNTFHSLCNVDNLHSNTCIFDLGRALHGYKNGEPWEFETPPTMIKVATPPAGYGPFNISTNTSLARTNIQQRCLALPPSN